MRRAAVVSFLVLYVLGPFVVQAEASEALALSLAELVHRNVIEPTESPTGGDDLNATLVQAAPHLGIDSLHAVPILPHTPGPPPAQSRPPSPANNRRPGEAAWPPAPRNARQACLQVFRF
jgi:hypothetical protein